MKHPIIFNHADIERGVNRAFGISGFWTKMWCFYTGKWIDPIIATTAHGFKTLRKTGLSYDQINEIRSMIHRVIGGNYKEHGYTVLPYPIPRSDDRWGQVIHRNKENFTGWAQPITVSYNRNQVYSQVMANLKRKYPETKTVIGFKNISNHDLKIITSYGIRFGTKLKVIHSTPNRVVVSIGNSRYGMSRDVFNQIELGYQ